MNNQQARRMLRWWADGGNVPLGDRCMAQAALKGSRAAQFVTECIKERDEFEKSVKQDMEESRRCPT